MDDALALRLDVFEHTDGIDPTVVSYVRTELPLLDLPEERMTDAVLGTFLSHLINAVNRTIKGEALNEFEAQEVIDGVIADRPELLERARALADRAERATGARLPETEIRILTLHLATF